MNNEEKRNSLGQEDIPSTSTVSKQEMEALQETGPGNPNPAVPIAIERPESIEAKEQQDAPDGLPSSSAEPALRTDEVLPTIAVKPVLVRKYQSFFEEQALPVVEMAPRIMRYRTRREVLAFGIGAAAVATGAGYLLPQNTLNRLDVRRDLNSRGKEWLLNNALRVDDDVAEALYSHNRMVPTYTNSQITPIMACAPHTRIRSTPCCSTFSRHSHALRTALGLRVMYRLLRSKQRIEIFASTFSRG
jgi:hypothetical protein